MRWNKPLAAVLLWASVVLASAQASPEAQPQAPFVHKKKYVMGTVFEIVAYGESGSRKRPMPLIWPSRKSSGSMM